MRFTLQARTPDTSRWSAVAAPGFGTWVSSAPGTSRYVYTKRVQSLLAPASYRILLRFRWTAPSGRTIARTRAYSAACKQPDPRANLVVSSLGVQPGSKAGRSRYVAFVRNTGRSAAGPSSLRVALNGTPLPLAAVVAARAGRGRARDVEGPSCTEAAPVDADADAGEVVEERDERTTASRACARPPS